jgi:hypothetical protein
MSKRELIDAIRQVNRTVAPEFLANFTESDLKAYLDRVCAVAHTHPSSVRPTVDGRHRLNMA